MVDIGRVCQPCVDSWEAVYKTVGIEIAYLLVSDPLHCEECEGQLEDGDEKWDVQP